MGTAQLGEELKDEEVDLIVAFLDSLTGKMPEVSYPVLPAETDATPASEWRGHSQVRNTR